MGEDGLRVADFFFLSPSHSGLCPEPNLQDEVFPLTILFAKKTRKMSADILCSMLWIVICSQILLVSVALSLLSSSFDESVCAPKSLDNTKQVSIHTRTHTSHSSSSAWQRSIQMLPPQHRLLRLIHMSFVTHQYVFCDSFVCL